MTKYKYLQKIRQVKIIVTIKLLTKNIVVNKSSETPSNNSNSPFNVITLFLAKFSKYFLYIFEFKNHLLNFSDDALESWEDFSGEVDRQLGPFAGFYGMKDWGAKLPGGVARLAGVFHVLTHDNPEARKISLKTVQQAQYVGSVLIEHAKHAYGVMGADEKLERAKIVLDWIQHRNKDRFSFREVQQLLKNRIAFGGSNTLEDALKELEERRFIQSIQVDRKGGRGRNPKPDYVVNPAALRGHGNE